MVYFGIILWFVSKNFKRLQNIPHVGFGIDLENGVYSIPMVLESIRQLGYVVIFKKYVLTYFDGVEFSADVVSQIRMHGGQGPLDVQTETDGLDHGVHLVDVSIHRQLPSEEE